MAKHDFLKASAKSLSSDVVVVGTGMAGLSAALQLVDRAKSAGQKVSVTLLEADSDIGGRTKTATIDGTPVNTGAHWFHGGAENPMFQWIKERYPQLETGIDDVSSQISIKGGKVYDSSLRASGLAMMEGAYNDWKKLHPNEDTSLADIAGLTYDEGAMDTARFFARCWMAEEKPEKISADEFFGCPYGAGGGLIKGGLAKLTSAMRKELEENGVKILTGRKVTDVAQHASGVTIADSLGRKYAAQDAIVTLPIGVLQQGGVHFDPPLPPDTKNYIDNTSISHFTKIIIPVDPAFLDARKIPDNTHIDILDEEAFCHCRAEGKQFVTLMTGGDEAIRVEKMPPAELKGYIEDRLDRVPLLDGWRDAVRGAPYVTKWNSNPLSLGTYTAMQIGMTRKDPQLDGHVVICGEAFAGEKDATEGPSMMVGAWFSGRKAADAVFDNLAFTPAMKPAPAAGIPVAMK